MTSSSQIHYLYLITREDGEKYVGVSKYPDRRLKEHQGKNGNVHLRGNHNLKMDIIAFGSREYIYSIEAEAIKKYEAKLNVHPGGCFPYNEPDRSGIKNGRAKFTIQDIIDIRNAYVSGETQLSIAKRYSRPAVTISKIVTGNTWKNAPGPISMPSQGKRPNSLTEETKIKIKELRKQGMSAPKIAKLLGIGCTTVYRYGRSL